jgi:hypothetical protein
MSEYVTANGVSIAIQAISLDVVAEISATQKRKALREGAALQPPSYTVTTVTGEKQTYQHDETTLKTDEDKKLWAVYKDAQKEVESASAALTMRYTLYNGIVQNPIPQDWLDELEWNGLEAPENERERRWLYIRTGLLKLPIDQVGCFVAIMKLSGGASEELQDKLTVLEDLFRRQMEGEKAK